jgi:hypothetical protein
LNGRGDASAAREAAEAAVGEGRFVPAAAEVLRRVRGATSANAQGYALRVQGRWPSDAGDGPVGFYRMLHVVAETPEEALAYAQLFEPVEVRASLRVESAEVETAAAGKLFGVYWASGHVFFPIESGS